MRPLRVVLLAALSAGLPAGSAPASDSDGLTALTDPCPPGNAETTRLVRLALELDKPWTAAARRDVGISHLGPDDIRLLQNPGDTATCRFLRSSEYLRDTDPPTTDMVFGYYQVGAVYLVAHDLNPNWSVGQAYRHRSVRSVGVFGVDGTSLGGISL